MSELVSRGLTLVGGVTAGALVGFQITYVVGVLFGYVIGDNGWTEGKVAAFLPVLVIGGAAALWSRLERGARVLLLGAAIGWLAGGSLSLWLFTTMD
jgi:hypothetical protein